jgi:NADPH-dependent ferric siderophore reductase
MGNSQWGALDQGARAAAQTRVEKAEKVLRRAAQVLVAADSTELPKIRRILEKKAEQVFRAKLHLLKVKLAAAEHDPVATSKLLRAQQALLSGGVNALLIEVDATNIIRNF